MLPLALQCRFHELLLMEKATRLLEQLPRIVPLAARVDGIYFTSKDEGAITELEALASRPHYPVSERCVYQIKADAKALPFNLQSCNYKARTNPASDL